MRTTYNKLVRDRIPEIIQSEGRQCTTVVLSKDEFLTALLDKLVEEADEVRNASSANRASELADLLEVLDAILKVGDLSLETVKAIQEKKRLERGGFNKRIKLLETE